MSKFNKHYKDLCSKETNKQNRHMNKKRLTSPNPVKKKKILKKFSILFQDLIDQRML